MSDVTSDRPMVLFVCTGNAARSVMGATMLRARTDAVDVQSAGTHSIPGLPMSTRTRTALAEFGVADLEHRSTQLESQHVAEASLIVIFEPMHLQYMRKKHPEGTARTASLPFLGAALPEGNASTLARRVEALDLGARDFEAWEEVVDPAGGEMPEFLAAASQIHELVDQVVLGLQN